MGSYPDSFPLSLGLLSIVLSFIVSTSIGNSVQGADSAFANKELQKAAKYRKTLKT
ncbi:hypothetical protein B188_05680 [Candidatus Brocadiaceae bacterium B188]|nr:hypothetical protein B188_05680 [Candidatus Brocadiaceae bacterium B188]